MTASTATYAFAPGTAEFPIEWQDESDPELDWERDDMHMPFALAPLAIDYIQCVGAGFAAGYEYLDIPVETRCRVWNGYVYFARWPVVSDAVRAEQRDQYTRGSQEHEKIVAAYWRDEALPELAELYDWIASRPVERATLVDLAEMWELAWQRTNRAWWIHFFAILGPYQVLEDLADFFEAKVDNATAGDALKLVQGGIDELQDVERGIERLTAMAAAEPALAERLNADAPPSIDELAATPGGAEFVAELRRFLDQHGHLGQGFDDLSLASWAEEPSPLLADFAKRLRHPAPPSDERRARLAAESEALTARVREQLADRPDDLASFEELAALAREIGPLTEGHNYWIDRKAQARIRVFALRVGRRLAAEGAFDDPNDIFYFSRAEVPELLRAPVDWRAIVAERRAEHARQRTITPPFNVGTPHRFETASPDRFDGNRFESTEEGVLKGTGASAGVARGPARVVLGPADFGRVQPGDIIVAPSSNPSWVPLFTIAGGLVTDTGGVLCHAAVVAREFALPAVVGLGDATKRIADGRLLEIDGVRGLVRQL
ncbi:MAG: PEP-utilizing enzyme [Chloroflexota bacterium]|nr:PEP-utilizing enzyme [Chloroflexota bacterium]